MRVHELAKELGVTSKELLGTLEQMGVSGKSASSSVPEDLVPRLRASGGKATEAPKRREVLEPPPAPRKPKPKKAAAPKAEPKPADVAPAPVAEAPAPVAAPASPAPAAAAPAPAAPAVVPAPAADAAAAPPNGRQPRGPRKPVVPEPPRPVLEVVRGATPQTIAEKVGKSPADIVSVESRTAS